MSHRYEMDSKVRGFHIYQVIWMPVMGKELYSRDLGKSRLEIPCTLIFQGDPSEIEKVKRLIKEAKEKAETKEKAKENASKANPIPKTSLM